VCNAAGASRLTALSPSKPPLLWPHLTHRIDGSPLARNPGAAVVRLLTVARAVPKKGLEILLDALARLPAEPAWTWTHIGGGGLLPELTAAARKHVYADRLSFLGAQPHSAVVESLRTHDVFVLPAVVSGDGDRDGRPNALIEAMDAGLACVATQAGGIPEVLQCGAGLLVAPEPDRIAWTLTGLLVAPERREALGIAARARAAELRAEGEAAFADLVDALRKVSGQ
jgi:glycosyltransferase involved in cell wall biosynthesis